jgi:hypothetical protein
MVPVLGGKVVEGQQRVTVLDQAGNRLLVLGGILLGEGGDRRLGRGAVGRLPDQGCSTLWNAEEVEEAIEAADGGAEAVLGE